MINDGIVPNKFKATIIDDNRQDLILISRCLRASFPLAQVKELLSLQAGIKEIQNEKPDIVVLDYYLKDGIGTDLINEISPKQRDFPILMVSSNHDKGFVRNIYQSGIDSFIPKPVDRLTLKTRVEGLLSVRRVEYAAYGDLGTMNINLDISIKALSELEARFSSPVFIAKGAVIDIVISGYRVECSVFSCTEGSNVDRQFEVKAFPNPDRVSTHGILVSHGLRKLIHALRFAPKKYVKEGGSL